MSYAFRFSCPLVYGMHARPASAIEHIARRFASDVSISNERTGQVANAKSVLGIVGLDIRQHDWCRIYAVGRDAAWAAESLKVFVHQTLPRVDDAVAAPEPKAGELRLPPVLQAAGSTVVPGIPVVGGIGAGVAFRVGGFSVPASIPLVGPDDIEAEVGRVEEAFGRLLRRYDERLEAHDPGVEADVLRAHRSVARDPEFGQVILHALRSRHCTAAGAIREAETQFGGMLLATGSALLRERVLDIRDVCRELMGEVYGASLLREEITLTRDSVCLAETLTPGQFLALDRRWLKGLALVHGGTTSHTVILARSHGVPTVVGVEGLDLAGLEGAEVIVDADLGAVASGLNDASRRYYEMERGRLAARRKRLHRSIERPAATDDGRRVEVAANVNAAAEVAAAVAGGADGVGLFRTEMLFLARKDAPSEEEQFTEYRRAVVDAAGLPVIVRTLDVGGDKPLPYLALPKEDNPFLGYRAVRIYPEFEGLFRTQVRALARASAFGQLRVMIPMIASLDEAGWVRRVVAEEQAKLSREGIAFDPVMKIGAMIEVPSAALMVPRLSEHLDFFAIGTNDLLQYFLAADRSSPRLAALANPLEPAFLGLLDRVVQDAHACHRWIGLCGEMGAQSRFLPLLVGLGLDEISMAPPEIASAKSQLGGLSAAACRRLAERAMQAAAAGEVAEMLAERTHWRPVPLIEPELVRLGADCWTKEEAIKAAVDQLFAAGRTDHPREVEDAMWRREAEYATGFGNGFAIPHCRTDAVTANSMAVIRLTTGLPWGAVGEPSVRTVIALAIRQSDEAAAHMRVLAALARQLMDEEFRAALDQAPDAETACGVVSRVIQ